MSGTGFKKSSPERIRDTFSVMRAGAEAGRLAHGYVVSCPQTSWGLELALMMLQWLFCREAERPCGRCRSCLHLESRSHPDVNWIEPESKSRQISIEQIRSLNSLLYQKSFEGGWKAAVIIDADRMTDNASNAFLKTLEEPPPLCLVMLLTGSAQKLLPTIISRCQKVDLGSDSGTGTASAVETAMLDWLRRRDQQPLPFAQTAWFGGILDEVRDRATKEETDRSGDEIDEDLLKARIQSRVIEARTEILRVLYKWERDMLACTLKADVTSLYYGSDIEALKRQCISLSVAERLARISRVEQATRLLEGNVPEAAVWEAVLPI